MNTVFVLFDSLKAGALGAYGNKLIQTPNFDRFQERAVTFDQHFVGSLPCMPARRDMHTGRLNFMHRSWGPLEPFDNSFPKIMSENGIYTHLISDHLHYFEEGGNGYAQAFDTWEFIRGQENDPWIGLVEPPIERFGNEFSSKHYDFDMSRQSATRGKMDRWRWKKLRHAVNRDNFFSEKELPLVQCFDKALGFIDRNKEAGNWFLQLEAFDPHEPFLAPDRFKEMYPTDWSGKILDWPRYERVCDQPDEIAEIQSNYAALVSMCDDQFGRVLDIFDELDLWENTTLILTTDHGYLLNEHEWWGKNRMPYYTEISKIPLMIHSPKLEKDAGKRCDFLTQTPDLMPTFLQMYGLDIPKEVQGQSIFEIMDSDQSPEKVCVFGQFGGPIAVTDGRYLMFMFPRNVDAEGLNEYTLSPSHMSTSFSIDELQKISLAHPFDFTKNVSILKIKAQQGAGRPPSLSPEFSGGAYTNIFDLAVDPGQTTPIEAPDIENALMSGLLKILKRHDTPPEFYEHYDIGVKSNSSGR